MLSLFAALGASEKWAVIFCGSNTWSNYRHTADSYYQYKVLREKGFPKEKIVLMCYDDIVTCAQNPFKGQIFRDLAHKNVYPGAENVDYKGKDVTAANLYKVLLGDTSSGKALASKADDYIFVFYDNHGGNGIFGVPSGCGPYIYANDLRDTFKKMKTQGKYKYTWFPITACMAGSVAKIVGEAPDILLWTASNEKESSYAVLYDPALGAYLTSEFSLIMHLDMEQNPKSTLAEAFPRIVAGVKLSHVCKYGDESIMNMRYTDFIYGGNEKTTELPVTRIYSKETDVRQSLIELNPQRTLAQRAHETFVNNMELQMEQKLDRVIAHLKNTLKTNADFSEPCTKYNWENYQTVVGYMQKKFGPLGEGFYARSVFFAHITYLFDAPELIAAISQIN
jgi:legumain